MLHCGVDWASDHHDVCIVDAEGSVRWRKRIGHDPEGIATLRVAIADIEPAPAQAPGAVESSHGLLVRALDEAGHVDYPINPEAAVRRGATNIVGATSSWSPEVRIVCDFSAGVRSTILVAPRGGPIIARRLARRCAGPRPARPPQHARRTWLAACPGLWSMHVL